MGTHSLTVRTQENFDLLVEADFFPRHRHLRVCGVCGQLFRSDVRRPAGSRQRCDCLIAMGEPKWKGFDYNEFARRCLFAWGRDRVFRNLGMIKFRGYSMTLRSYLIVTGRAAPTDPDLGREAALLDLMARFGARVTPQDLLSFQERFAARLRCSEKREEEA
jgi:hypothetical protein